MKHIKSNMGRKLVALLLVAGLVIGSVLGGGYVSYAETTVSGISKYLISDAARTSYTPPVVFPMSDGTIWYGSTSGSMGLRHFDPATGTFSAAYAFPTFASMTRYRYLVGPDDNIYSLASDAVSVFNTTTHDVTNVFLSGLTAIGYEGCTSDPYGDFTFSGDKLVLPMECVAYDADDDSYTYHFGIGYVDLPIKGDDTDTTNFVEVPGVSYGMSPFALANDGAGSVTLISGSGDYYLFETDCATGRTSMTKQGNLDPEMEYGGMLVSMTGTPPFTMDQQNNLYFPAAVYDDDAGDYRAGIVKYDLKTDKSQFVADPDEFGNDRFHPLLVRGNDDNIYYASAHGVKRFDITTDTIVTIFDNLVANIGGYNGDSITLVNGPHIWTGYCEVDEHGICAYDEDSGEPLHGFATFSITDGKYPNRDPYTCPSIEDPDPGPNPPPIPQQPPTTVPGVPNTGVY